MTADAELVQSKDQYADAWPEQIASAGEAAARLLLPDGSKTVATQAGESVSNELVFGKSLRPYTGKSARPERFELPTSWFVAATATTPACGPPTIIVRAPHLPPGMQSAPPLRSVARDSRQPQRAL